MKRSGFRKKPIAEIIAKKRAKVNSVRKAPKKRRSKANLPSQRQLKDKLWAECKRIIRERHGDTCYTCRSQGLQGSNWQTGHFIPSSVCSVHMRYSLDNLRPQCMRCNIHLSGNWIEYEKHLRADGIDTDALKAENEATKNKQYDRTWHLNKIEEYKKL